MANSCNVKVAARCRPSNSEERKGNQPTVITCDLENSSLTIKTIGPVDMVKTPGKKVLKDKEYTFNKVFGINSTQQEVYESTAWPIVMKALDGFNGTIFVYGQTGVKCVNCDLRNLSH